MKKNYYLFLMFFAILGVSANSQNIDAISVAQGTNNPVYYNSPEAIPACGYVQPTVGFENGYPSIIGSSSSADDIVIAANDCWTINTVSFEAWTNSTITAADITFMDNNSGNPGAISNGGTAQAISCPFVATLIGTNGSYNIYEVVCTLPTPITLCAGVSPTNFWLSCQGTSSATLYWGFQTAVPYNLTGKYTTTPLTAPWTNNSYHFVFKLNANGVTTNQNITICNGASYTVGTSTYSTTGNYSDVLTSSCSTDSTVNTNLTVLPAKTSSVTTTICNNGSVVVNGNTYNAGNPTGTEVITNVGPFNCDSTVTVNLTVLAALTGSVTTTICNNGSVVVNGTTYNAGNPTGTEVISNVGPSMCDSTVTVNLNVLAALTGSVTTTICNEDTVIVNGTPYYAGNPSGTEVFTNVGPFNCDSTVNVNLNVLAALTGSVSSAICDGDSIIVNGTNYNASNLTGTEVFTNVGPNMCDSTVIVNLTLNTVDVSVTSASPMFTANATTATYQWVDCNNNFAAISGETNASFTATANGDYAVIVTQNGCTDTSACVNVTGVGIETLSFKQVNVFPNPANNVINVNLGDITTAVNFTLTSIDGKVVYQENNVNNSKTAIDISNNAKGVYFLKVETNNKQQIFKVVKE